MSDEDRTEEERAAGELARGVTAEINRPLRQLRESLALMVESLDRHMAEAGGPVPLPYKALEALRHELGEAYLEGRRLSRLVEDLSGATVGRDHVVQSVDVSKIVESALNLTQHRISSDTEVFVDLGTVPSMRSHAGELLLLMSTLLGVCAESTHGIDGAAVSVKTRRDGDEICVLISDNGRGAEDGARHGLQVADSLARRLGAHFAGTSEAGKGSAFDLRLPLR